MKHLSPLVFAVVLLAGCSAGGTNIAQQNENPLTATRYGDELADNMAGIIIAKDPIADDAAARRLIDAAIIDGKEISAEARLRMAQGILGPFISVSQEVFGYALLLDSSLHLSSDFVTDPGLDLHMYLTSVVDPRDVEFPDPTAVDLGAVQSVYGAQTYEVDTDTSGLRTVVVWDRKLKRIYGFVQLSK